MIYNSNNNNNQQQQQQQQRQQQQQQQYKAKYSFPGCQDAEGICILAWIFRILTARMQSQDALGCKTKKKTAIRRPPPATTSQCQDAPGCNILIKIAASWMHPGSLCDATVCVVASTLHPRCIPYASRGGGGGALRRNACLYFVLQGSVATKCLFISVLHPGYARWHEI